MIRSIIAVCVIVVGGFIIHSNYDSPTTLVGEVYMEVGETAPFAEVKIFSVEDHQLVRAELADANGNFSFADLEAGNYTLEVSYVGYKDYKMPLALCSNKETSTGSIDLESGFNNSDFAARPNKTGLIKA